MCFVTVGSRLVPAHILSAHIQFMWQAQRSLFNIGHGLKDIQLFPGSVLVPSSVSQRRQGSHVVLDGLIFDILITGRRDRCLNQCRIKRTCRSRYRDDHSKAEPKHSLHDHRQPTALRQDRLPRHNPPDNLPCKECRNRRGEIQQHCADQIRTDRHIGKYRIYSVSDQQIKTDADDISVMPDIQECSKTCSGQDKSPQNSLGQDECLMLKGSEQKEPIPDHPDQHPENVIEQIINDSIPVSGNTGMPFFPDRTDVSLIRMIAQDHAGLFPR